MYLAGMFGWPDYLTNRRTGRPEAHHSWACEALFIWWAWGGAATFAALAAFIVIGNAGLGSLIAAFACAGAAAIFGSLALWRRRALKRKREAYRTAVLAYEEGLRRAFD